MKGWDGGDPPGPAHPLCSVRKDTRAVPEGHAEAAGPWTPPRPGAREGGGASYSLSSGPRIPRRGGRCGSAPPPPADAELRRRRRFYKGRAREAPYGLWTD